MVQFPILEQTLQTLGQGLLQIEKCQHETAFCRFKELHVFF